MANYTVIPQALFEDMQLDAGILLSDFDPSKVTSSSPGYTDTDIICATTGGIHITCVPTYSDLFEDVDNAPMNTKEGKHLDGWECKIAFTGLGTSVDQIKLALGVADVTTASGKVTPRRSLAQTDFSDLWWVGDKAGGGYVAVHLLNALSTSGLDLQTTKNGKGQIEIELTGHVSINAQDTVPMEFYSADAQT